jgi:thioredoxin reductase (NADPH)
MYDLLIIGGGPAGITAGIYAARAGMNAAVIERFFPGGQAAKTYMLENYPGFANGISGMDFAFALKEQAEHLGAEIKQEEITRLDLCGEVKIAYTQNEALYARTMILAMGAKPKLLGVPGEEKYTGAGVSYCATCDGAFYKGKDVAVVGGGDTAGEDALYLSKIAKTVYIVHRRSEYRMQKNLQERIQAAPNIAPVLEYIPAEIAGDGFVKSLELKNVRNGEKKSVPLQGVFVAVGIEPETQLAEGQIALDGGYILADEGRGTSEPGVFAAGDIVKKPLRQVVTAVSDGAVAVYSAQHYLTEKGY